MFIYKNVKLSKHAFDRFFQRKVENSDLKQFIKFIKNNLCVVVFEHVKDGNINGIPKRYKFGATSFIVTFDLNQNVLVVKTCY